MNKTQSFSFVRLLWLATFIIAITPRASAEGILISRLSEPTLTPTPFTRAINLSTRMLVQSGDNAAVAGFIITGSDPVRVLIRAIGPSLTQSGVPDALADPLLQLYFPRGPLPFTNDNWRGKQEAEIIATGNPPTNDLESAMVLTLSAGEYTAVVRAKENTSGVALVEIYGLGLNGNSKLANVSTRALVGAADNIVIAGFILGNGPDDDRIILRGLGPSMVSFPNLLPDPNLELRNSNGAVMISNDNWQENPQMAAQLVAAGLAPANDLESGIYMQLSPGLYTALLSGRNDGAGIGLIEIYDLGGP